MGDVSLAPQSALSSNPLYFLEHSALTPTPLYHLQSTCWRNCCFVNRRLSISSFTTSHELVSKTGKCLKVSGNMEVPLPIFHHSTGV